MLKNNFFRSGSHALLSGLAQQGLALLHFLLVARWLTPDALGTWAMFLVLVSFIDMSRLGLIQNALVHYGTHNKEDRPKIFSASLVLGLGLNIVGALILIAVSYSVKDVWQMPELPILTLNYLILAIITAILRFVEGVRMMAQDFKTSALSASIFGVSYLLFTVLLKLLGVELTGLILLWLQIPSYTIALIVVWSMNRSFLVLVTIEKDWLQKLFMFGRYGMGTNLCSMFFQRADVILLGAFVSPASLATYNVATRLIAYLDFPLNALGLALLPRIAAEHQEGGTAKVMTLYEKSVGWLLAITLPITMATIFGAEIGVRILSGNKFLEATVLVQILAVAGIVKPWGRLFGVTLDAVGKPHWNFRMLLMSMFITIILNWIFIPLYGILGAAIATSLSVVVSISIGQILLSKWIPIKALRSFEHILPTYQALFKKVKLKY